MCATAAAQPGTLEHDPRKDGGGETVRQRAELRPRDGEGEVEQEEQRQDGQAVGRAEVAE